MNLSVSLVLLLQCSLHVYVLILAGLLQALEFSSQPFLLLPALTLIG